MDIIIDFIKQMGFEVWALLIPAVAWIVQKITSSSNKNRSMSKTPVQRSPQQNRSKTAQTAEPVQTAKTENIPASNLKENAQELLESVSGRANISDGKTERRPPEPPKKTEARKPKTDPKKDAPNNNRKENDRKDKLPKPKTAPHTLLTPQNIRQAIIASEILGKPKSLR